jgi:hypothetical protein
VFILGKLLKSTLSTKSLIFYKINKRGVRC